MNGLLTQALNFHRLGLNVVPCKPREKTSSFQWRAWQLQRQSQNDVRELFEGHDGNTGIVCGIGSGNLGVLDCDDGQVFERFSGEFARHHGETWIVRSYRGGHIYFVTPRPVATIKGDGYEIRGHGSYVLAPGSIHPQGGTYSFVSQPERIARIETLNFCKLKFLDAARLEQEAKRNAKAIYGRYSRKHYPSLSEFDQAIIVACVNSGVPLPAIRSILRDSPGRTHYKRLLDEFGAQRADDNLLRSFSKAMALGDSPEATEAMRRAKSLRELAEQRIWYGRSGPSRCAVALAHAARCEQAKKLVYFFSARDGAEKARVSSTTFTRWTKWLSDEGLIKRENRNHYEKAARYSINSEGIEKLRYCPTPSRSEPNEGVCHQRRKFDFGVFERSGLGKACECVWHVLLRVGDMQYMQVVRQSGRAESTVADALKKLIRYGLAQKVRRTYRAVEEVDMEQLANVLGTSDLARRRRDEHYRDRLLYQRELELLRERGELPPR